MVGVDLEPVHYYFRVDSSHVFVRPSEVIMVLFEKIDKSSTELGAKACSYLEFVIEIVRMDTNFIQLVDAWLVGI